MDFYDIALAKFLQSFPELGNFIITFQDLTEQLSNAEESETSVGVFILRAGNDYYYVPVIAKGENLYPIDSMFSVSKEKFLPITPKTIMTVVNANSFNLGKADKIPTTVPKNPSVYELVNPPRTGKFVYASSSRLSEFLSIIPNDVKEFVKNKITTNKNLYQGMNNMFGLKEILEPLSKPTLPPIPAIKQYDTPTNVSATNVSVLTGGTGLSAEDVKGILNKGYVIKGENNTNRIAITSEDFDRVGRMSQAGLLERNKEYTFVLGSGASRDAFIPRLYPLTRDFNKARGSNYPGELRRGTDVTAGNVAIFENGDFALTDNGVIQGEPRSTRDVLQTLFNYRPPVMLKELEGSETFALVTPDMELIGVYRSYNPPMRNGNGVVIKGATDLLTHRQIQIHGYRNIPGPYFETDVLYVPFDVLTILLSNNISYDLEINVNAAQKKRSLAELVTLGASLDLGYDGIEFSINGSPIGAEPKVMEILVVKEGIEPNAATSFVKQAKERKSLKIYLSKKADFVSGDVPEYGEKIPPTMPDQLVQGENYKPNFEQNVGESMSLEDPQTTEATILAELLQAPDMYQYIEEYMPDIEEALDKLGRILFLLRINLEKFGDGRNPSEIFSFVSQLRNVYKMLGDNFIKLQQILANSNVSTEAE